MNGFVMLLAMVLPVIFGVISFCLWQKNSKDEKPVETVEFYPPDGFNSAEVAFLYYGFSKIRDIITLMIYLANKGFLKIVESELTGSLSGKNEFSFVKVKEYDGENTLEKLFFEGLFSAQSTVLLNDLRNKFPLALSSIHKSLSEKQNKDTIFEKKMTGKQIAVILMLAVTAVLVVLGPGYEYGSIRGMIVGFIKSAAMGNPTNLIAFLIELVCMVFMIILLTLLPKRTAYGKEMLGKIRGFKNFLMTAEESKLRDLINQDPTYFYTILPYAYTLYPFGGWIEKFETVVSEPPGWYESPNRFDMMYFNKFMTAALASVTKATSSDASKG